MLRRFQRLACNVLLAFVFVILAPPQGLALDPHDNLADYGRQTWQTGSGLPQNTVHAILQDREGYLWLGTEGGLVRFDGIRFAVFDTANTPQLHSNNVTSLMQDGAGNLWAGTPEGLTRVHQTEFRTYTTENGLPSNTISALSLDPSGALQVSTPEGKAHLEWDHFLRETPSTIAFNNGAISVRDASGRQWTGTNQGLTVSESGVSKTYTDRDGLPGNRISALYADREGSVWVGTDSGAARIVNGDIESFPLSDILSRDTILTIYEDREANLWIGTDSNGLTILRNQAFKTYDTRRGTLESQIRCLFQDRNGTVWIGTNGGGLSSLKEQRFSTFTTADGLASNVILSLAEDSAGDLLIGTPDGLSRLHNGLLSAFKSPDALAEDFIRSIYAEANGAIWIGTRHGLSQIEHNRVNTFTQANGLGSDLVGAIVCGPKGELWISTLHGLTRYSNRTFTNYTVEDGLSSNVITDLYFDREGVLWIATQGGGLDSLRNGAFTRYTSQLGIPETIYGVVEDDGANLWLAAKNGIFRVSKSDLEKYSRHLSGNINVASYGTSDGLKVSECIGGGHPAVWKSRDGTIWFSTAKGAAELRARRDAPDGAPTPVVLESIAVDDRAFNPAELTAVAPGHTRLAFEYAGLNFAAPQKVQFKYELQGFDHEWIYAGNRRVAYYTNLPPGHYRFHVMARNNDALWNGQGAAFGISIQPHYYQTWWFATLLLVGAALLAYAIYRWRVRQVQAQFDAVLQERNRIAREIHDTLAQGFVGVSVQLEIVSRLLNSSAESAKEHLDQARIQVRRSLSDARQSIWELRSQSPEHRDFAARISNMAKQAADPSSTKVQLQVHGTYRPLNQKVEDELFRIGQEAVTNSLKHSGAQRINIDLTFEARKVRMTVRDDGRGFNGRVDSYGPNGHFGLKGMRERAEQIHGDLQVTSEIGKGTEICIEVQAK